MGGCKSGMTLRELKNEVLSGHLKHLVVLGSAKNDYLPLQYAKFLANAEKLDLKIIEDLKEYPRVSTVFEEERTADNFYLCRLDSLDYVDEDLINVTNLIISAKKIKKEISSYCSTVIELPEIEAWQIHKYIQGICQGLSDVQVERLAKSCGYNLDKLDAEMAKLRVFAPAAQSGLFDVFMSEDLLGSCAEETIYDLTNSLQTRDIEKIKIILKNISKIDIESTGLITLLSNNFKKLIKVWLAKNPTEASTGLKSNQIWAISKLPRTYSKDQLLKVLKMVNETEYKLKNGELPENLIIDYLITSVLTA